MDQSLNGGTLLLPATGERIAYTVTHRARVTRRMHLGLDAAGDLLVTVPRNWPLQQVHELLLLHLPGIQRSLSRLREQQLPPLRWRDGAQHLFQGQLLALQLQQRPGRGVQVTIAGDRLLISGERLDSDRVQAAMGAFYHRAASAKFACRLQHHQQRAPWAQGRPLRLALRRMRRTWGTCNHEGVIRLNTHLIKAPTPQLDYVICHELCHLREMNHSTAFYALQSELYPDWQAQRQALKTQGHRYLQM